MKISLVKSAFIGVLALTTSAFSFAAPITDLQDFTSNLPGEYFVANDALKNSSPYYRDMNQDWSWTHNAIGGVFSSIKLNISAYDVDYSPAASGEHDEISVWDGLSWFVIGELSGSNNAWAFTDFDLSGYAWAQAQVNSGLKVHINIDKNNTSSWLVTLGKATLTLDGGNQQCVPTPGVPCTPTNVPEPSPLMLLGLGILGFSLLRRRIAK